VSSTSTPTTFQLCSRIYYRLKSVYIRYIGGQRHCCALHERTTDKKKERARLIRKGAPHCACEQFRMSPLSPAPITASEPLRRFIFSPLHTHRKTGKILPNLFNQAFRDGCSIQREAHASDQELGAFVGGFLAAGADRKWMGTVVTSAAEIRAIELEGERAFAAYDTAEPQNPAHGEIFVARAISEADEVELRARLFSIFGDGSMEPAVDYRGGRIWQGLDEQLRAR
jgi:hypothetical protein